MNPYREDEQDTTTNGPGSQVYYWLCKAGGWCMTYFWLIIVLGGVGLGALLARDYLLAVTYVLFATVVLAAIGTTASTDTEDGKLANFCKIYALIATPLLLAMVYSLVYTS